MSKHHRFHYRYVRELRPQGIFTLRSKSKKKYFLMGGNTGQLSLAKRGDPRAQMKFTSCKLP